MQIITKKDIMGINDIKDLSLKQRKINEFEYAFYKNEAVLESSDMWDMFYESIHKKTSYDETIRLKAFSNVFENQLKLLRMKNGAKLNNGR
ncbi:MAG: hypothetical protein IJL05_00825 [Alphaproteobacteria bacterium]|nr:hypothetical protein [Alphaproteobacteria bacterium]